MKITQNDLNLIAKQADFKQTRGNVTVTQQEVQERNEKKSGYFEHTVYTGNPLAYH